MPPIEVDLAYILSLVKYALDRSPMIGTAFWMQGETSDSLTMEVCTDDPNDPTLEGVVCKKVKLTISAVDD